ncbi:MAG TPA: triose-phosphate isomerase [archaeon]|nr:triose-phosphate isomerase [archaeon]
MQTPLILVNFKNYKESCADSGVRLAEVCDSVSKESGVNIIVAPQYTDLKGIKSTVKIPVFAQHIDPIEKGGAYTGHIVAENLEGCVSGSLINHSERKLNLEDIEKCVKILKGLSLVSVCCAASVDEAEKIAKFDPDFIAIEPPELIGSGVSVTTRPEIVISCVEVVKKVNPNVKVLCGAGITTGQDVKKALDLGAHGVLVASGVVKAQNPKKVLEEFVKSIK